LTKQIDKSTLKPLNRDLIFHYSSGGQTVDQDLPVDRSSFLFSIKIYLPL